MCFSVLSSLRLKPFTSYQFRIKATNDIGDSEYSQESEAITTLQDGKSNTMSKNLYSHRLQHKNLMTRCIVYLDQKEVGLFLIAVN